MEAKILIEKYLDYRISESDDEYTPEQKELLEKSMRARKPNNTQNEIFPFYDSTSEDFDNDEIEEEETLDAKAWGRKRNLFYNTDFVDQDYSTYNEKEEELAHDEEQEAKQIQLRLAAQLKDTDFDFDNLTHSVNEDLDTTESYSNSKLLKTNFDDLSLKQKLDLFVKDSPEFMGLMRNFDNYSTECAEVLRPAFKYFEKYNNVPLLSYVITKLDIIHTYCLNILFYLILKSKRKNIKFHPVVKRLLQSQKLLLELDEKFKDKFDSWFKKFVSLDEATKEKLINEMSVSDSLLTTVKSSEENNEMDNNEEMANNQVSQAEIEQDIDSRRGITYQIAKNKGLIPSRKKEQRNPRVKHKNKFRKALIRRKGAVRTVRKEIKKYSGEISGIKATVKKSVKIK